MWDGQQFSSRIFYTSNRYLTQDFGRFHPDMATYRTASDVKHTASVPQAPDTSASLTADVLPEASSPQPEGSQTGVSFHYASKQDHQWYVLRATYGRADKAYDHLKKTPFTVFHPTRRILRNINGTKKYIIEPILPNIIFIYATPSDMTNLMSSTSPTYEILRYYRNRTRPREAETGKHPPLTVPEAAMRSFILITATQNEHNLYLPPNHACYQQGDMVRIIQGQFAGVTGRVTRIAGQRRVAVSIEGILTACTAYVPSAFMERC